ncbi:MBB1A-like protein [Mya arenaria]|uniref:MBB1A-like protein n=1 Tax=Mya arenaria TaxID=6604 RepID=A0ABY7E0L5_MYAAR|nr:MBB1A-like protein [Mya arenaria]
MLTIRLFSQNANDEAFRGKFAYNEAFWGKFAYNEAFSGNVTNNGVINGLNSDVKYAVNRLVQGLSSGRKFARQGFSTALCQTLRVIENVDSQLVLTVIKEKSKPLLAGKPSKAEVSNVYLGQVCGMLALVNSGRLYKDGDGAVGQVVEQLLKLGREKSQLQQLCASGLAQIISKASQNTFKQSILPHLEEDVKSGWKDCSPDRLLLLIYIDKYHNAIVKKKLKEHWGDGHIVVEKNFKQLADIVWRSSSFHPLVHVAVDELLSSVVDRGQDLVKFWTTVARPLLAVNATAPKKILGLHIFEKLLPNLKNEKQVSALVNHITNCENSEVQLAVVKCLTSKPGSCLLDKFTGTNILAKIMTGLQPKAQEIVIEELMKAITLQSNWIMPKESSHIAESLQWCTKELTMFVTNDNTESPLQLKILQLCKVQSGELPAGVSRMAQLNNHLDVLNGLVQYANQLLSSPEHVQLRTSQHTDERKSEEKMTGSHAFELLFFHTGLQLFVETEAAIESLQDLHVYGPAWIEVVTELLLSLMFKGSVLSRNVANVVMSALAQNVTPEALQLIVDEEEEDVELSDTEMFQLDEVLAAAFRSMKKSGRGDKDRKKQLNTFKSRVLDLVDVLIKHHPTPTVLKTFLLPLVDRVEGGVRKQQEVSLGNRARSTLALMFKVKKLEPDFDVDKDELLDLFGQLLKYASKVSLPALVTDIAKACVLIIRMVSENSGPSPLKTRAKAAQHPKPIGQYVDSVVAMVRAAMLDLFSHKSGHCPPAVFHVLLPRFTTQAASILASMINKQVVHEVNEDDWSKFLKSWKKQFSEILEEPETEKLDALRSQLNQEGRGHLNKICPRQQHGGCSKKKKKEKKRKQKDAIQENGSHSPGKKSRHENGIPDEDSDELGDEVDAMNVEVNNVQSFGNLEASTPSPSKKKKKKKRSKSQSEGDKSIVNDSLSNEVAMDVDVNDEGDDALTTSVEVKCKLDDATVGENELSKSAKKKKKRKSRAGGDDSMNEMGQVSSDLVSSNENVTEKQNESDIAKMKDDLNASNISTPGKKKHKKNKRKSLDQGHLPS